MSRMGGTAFFVETDRELRERIASALVHDGFTVELPQSGADALDRFAAAAPVLVVASLSSATHDGALLCKGLRQRSASVRLVLYCDETVVARSTDWAERLDCDVVVVGPFDYARLRDSLRGFGLVDAAPRAPSISFSVPMPEIPSFEVME